MPINNKVVENVEVLVIGGGASGMMAAGRAAECGKQVILLEKNADLGKKLKITGGGRCNITNAELDAKKLLACYGLAEQFLYSPFAIFGVKETFKFFESRGLSLIIEAGNRAFPKSEKALDVFNLLAKYMKEGGVQVRHSSPVISVEQVGGKIVTVTTATHIYRPGKVILASGGNSHPETGSSGDGFAWLRKLGHTVKDPTPDIVPLAISEPWVRQVAGVAIGDAKMSFYCCNKKVFSDRGRILFTHFGISGPTVLNLASRVRDLLHDGVVILKLDLFPSQDVHELEQTLIKLFDDNKNKLLKNVMSNLLPPAFVQALKSILPTITWDVKVHSLKKEDRKLIVKTLKSLELNIDGLMGMDKAVVSDGGVLLSEIDTRSMQSKVCSNLYVTGDLLHISRPTGGYSLQLCWTTGYIAGSSV